MHEITKEYQSEYARFEGFRIKMEVLVRELLVQNDINYHKIESRIKDVNRLDEKISRKNEKYKALGDITDLVGIRIITYFEDEVDKVASIIKAEFSLDKINTIDKRKLETDRFGYKSLHYVVALSDKRKLLTEYKRFKEIKVEIQIRSVLQHAWAEIEHDIGYKGEQTVPDSVKRSFFRVAALLETADIEFVNLRQSLSKYEETVAEHIKKHPEEVEINGPSVLSFVGTDTIAIKMDNEIAAANGMGLEETNLGTVAILVNMLKYVDVKTIKELENKLSENQSLIVPFMKKWAVNGVKGSITRGICIFYLCYILVAQKEDLSFSQAYYEEFFAGSVSHVGADINGIYKEVRSK